MAILERLLPRKEAEPVPLTPVVRLVITQPIPHAEMAERIYDHSVPVSEIEFTRSAWIIKGPDAINPRQIVPLGGGISEEDNKEGKKQAEKQRATGETDQGDMDQRVLGMTQQIAAWRQAFEKIHLQGVGSSQILPIPNGTKQYEFRHRRRGRLSYHETWMTAQAPWDFRPFILHQKRDKIGDVVMPTPSETASMFENNALGHMGEIFPLVDNLNADPAARKRKKVVADQQDILRVREMVLTHIQQKEREYRVKLAYQMIYHSVGHPAFGGERHGVSHDNWWQRIQDSLQRPASFDEEYRKFIQVFRKELPNDQNGTGTRDRDTVLRDQVSAAWHRVQWEEYTKYTTQFPVQGDWLAASWLPLEKSTNHEMAYLELEGPENVRRVLGLINRALSPSVTEDEITRLGPRYRHFLTSDRDGSLSLSDQYKRIELYRNLKMNELNLGDDELLFYKAWWEHMQAVVLEETGMTGEEFAEVSDMHNAFAKEIVENVAPKVNAAAGIPTQLRRHPSSLVSQFDELLMMAYGYSQYRDVPRGDSSLSPQAINDARVKLYALFHERDVLRSYKEGIKRSTYFWRKHLDGLQPDGAKEIAYTIYPEKRGKQTVITAAPDAEGMRPGISVTHKQTTLVHQGVPVAFFEITNDKELLPFFRKSLERGWTPEQILDRQRTQLTIDTESEEAKTNLQMRYQEWLETGRDGKPYADYQTWVKKWAIDAIRDTLVPGLQDRAQASGYHFALEEEKDMLDSNEATAGSGGSKGGYPVYKVYVVMDPTHVLADGSDRLSNEAEKIEMAAFPTPADTWKKKMDDGDYAVRRLANVLLGSSLRPLWNLMYPYIVYPVYSEVAGENTRDQEEQDQKKKSRIRRRIESIFGPIRSTVYPS